jgi:hypothetical protein
MAKQSLSKDIGAWKALAANVKARLPELPQLTATVEALDALIAEAEEFQRIHGVHRRQMRETTQYSKDIERRGRSFRNRLITGVQSAYGVDNMLLVEFGINPRLPKRRNRLTQEQRAEKERLEELEKAAAEAGLEV